MPRYSGRVRVRTCQMQVWVLGPLGLPLTQYRSGLAGQGLATGLDSRLSGEAIPHTLLPDSGSWAPATGMAWLGTHSAPRWASCQGPGHRTEVDTASQS